MHKSPAIMLITAKKSAMGDVHPDYSGKMGGARVVMADDVAPCPSKMDDKAGPADPGPDMPVDFRAELAEIKKELQKASKTHAKQADRIGSLLESGDEMPPDPGPEAEKGETYGEKRELA
tara:strand:- start:1871 stop:2230 length:360 start_codon:yes stop_codon:yes gene_type:complete